MVLVDTSVWIHFISRRLPHAVEMYKLLDANGVSGHDLVYGELLIGDRGARSVLLSNYPRMKQARTVPHSEVVAFARDRELHGRGIGWIDAHLLASALVERMQLWTADLHLFAVAKELGVAYESGGPLVLS